MQQNKNLETDLHIHKGTSYTADRKVNRITLKTIWHYLLKLTI